MVPMIEKKMSSLRSETFFSVASVQSLAESRNGEIPQRYIRPEVESSTICTDFASHLPVIDFRQLLDPVLCQEESSKLDRACEQWGFFQLINHGVSSEVIDKIKDDIAEFFKLPLDEKRAYAIAPGSPEGYGQHFLLSKEQKLDWADMMYIKTQPTALRNIRFWPAHPPTFRDTLDKYSLALKEVASCLLGILGRNLNLMNPESNIVDKLKDQQSVRINYYPPCPEPNKVLGLYPHSDNSALTILLQLNDVQGLQVCNNHKWFPIKALPASLIVNIGDVLEIMSNGKYKSVEHRAVVNREKERLSIATFHMPMSDCIVGPLPELVQRSHEKYKSLTCENYTKAFFGAKLDGKSLLESMKLQK